ncbi:MAG TPA: hypothetical protein VKG92_05845 [Flavobacteriales bacterium]|nr:hypothetical protein [Flavobacteriales bacterium]
MNNEHTSPKASPRTRKPAEPAPGSGPKEKARSNEEDDEPLAVHHGTVGEHEEVEDKDVDRTDNTFLGEGAEESDLPVGGM